MSIAITDDHRALAQTVAGFLAKCAQARGHHHDGDRHACAGRHSPAAADAYRKLGFQRGGMAATLVLMNRAMSIAGGTSEIKRNQIAEQILGLPRDPLIR